MSVTRTNAEPNVTQSHAESALGASRLYNNTSVEAKYGGHGAAASGSKAALVPVAGAPIPPQSGSSLSATDASDRFYEVMKSAANLLGDQ
jgi:hypothetical protein